MHRFFVPAIAADSDVIELPEDQARHATRVLRLQRGDALSVFDGRGAEYHATIERAERGTVTVRLLGRIEAAREPSVRLTLAQAVLKGDKMDAIVRDATMLGVAEIVPVVTRRTVVPGAALARGRVIDRWRRIAVASAKQSRRAVVPAVADVRTFEDLIRPSEELRLLLVEPPAAGERTVSARSLQDRNRPAAAMITIGPEGGWSREEVEAAVAAGFVPMTLGDRTLRADAVPVVAIALLQFVWEDL